jgi:hypothetical protein
VDVYKYLGVYITADGKWDTHLTQRMQTATASANAQRKVLKNTRLPIRLRKLTLTAVVQPALTHAAQVWVRPTATMRRRLDAWQMAAAAQFFHCPPTTAHICLQQELGITPLHITCETLAIRYWHHLQTVPQDRLLWKVANAWTGRANPWQQNVQKLLQEYSIDSAVAASLTHAQFKNYCAAQAMQHLNTYWGQPPRQMQGAIQNRYKAAFGQGLTKPTRPCTRPYLMHLTEDLSVANGKAAELCMHMRIECLPLKAMHMHSRANESATARHARMQCPCCRQAPETPTHFLLECPAYSAPRVQLFHTLQDLKMSSPVTGRPLPPNTTSTLLEHFRQLDAAQAWRTLMGSDYLEMHVATGSIANYIMAAWSKRRAALDGREANGGNPMALTPVPGPDAD